jgi:ATP-binding cassette subfamily F protein 3
MRLRPDEAPARLRSRLATGGLASEVAVTPVGRLSGGQKARLSLLLATLDAPHLIILDEPTNHLDIESREALVRALTEYAGAVILVSHDPHLIDLVADRLWLVNDGRVAPFEDDLDGYRRWLLSDRKHAAPPDPPARTKPKQARARQAAPLEAEVARCEARMAKLEEIRSRIDARLSNPLLYNRGDVEEIAQLRRKRAEVEAGLERAEALWLTAMERLDAAGAAR